MTISEQKRAEAIAELVELLRHEVVRWEESPEQASEFARRVMGKILAHASLKTALTSET